MKNNKWGIYGIIICLFLLMCRSKFSENDVAARVGNTILTKDALKNKMASEGVSPDQQNGFIEKWVNNELLVLEARRQGLDKAPEIRDEMNNLENDILVHKLLDKIFAEQIRFSDGDLNSFYEKNKYLFAVVEEEVHVLHILTKTQSDANQVLQEIRAGKVFEEIAKVRSIDSFREKGGDMGFIKRTDVIPEMVRIAFSTSEGAISPVFSSSYGFHILKVLKKYKPGDIQEFRDARNDVLQRLRVNKERTVYMDLLYQLQNKYKVYVASSQN